MDEAVPQLPIKVPAFANTHVSMSLVEAFAEFTTEMSQGELPHLEAPTSDRREVMKAEDKVTSLELSEKLKAAGAVQESHAWWIEYDDVSGSSPPFCLLKFSCHIIGGGLKHPSKKSYELNRWSAFDCAELLEMLPLGCGITKTRNGYLAHSEITSVMWVTDAPAEAFGKLWLWLLKEGHVK